MLSCRSCKSTNLELVINLGNQYLSDFRPDDLKPNRYPLELMKCQNCHFCQLKESAPLSEMYTENYGFKSGVNEVIKEDLKNIVDQALSYVPSPRLVLDIGSNDGTLLMNYENEVVKVGIDPIKKLCDEATARGVDVVINDFFSLEALKERVTTKFDIITASSMFYDVEDPDQLIKEMALCLKDTGVLTIQQNYILATLKYNAYDNICHEHIGYHSLLSMEYLFEKHGLEVVDVSTSMVNGGVLRTVVQKKGVGTPTSEVQKQRDIEKEFGLDTSEPYTRFRKCVEQEAHKLKKLVTEINKKGEKCYIYAASTRGATIWQYVGLDVYDLPFAVERNPGKVGKKIASIGVPIISENQGREDMPDYMLVSIWFFRDQVIQREQSYLRRGGKLIFCLPTLEVVGADFVF